MQTAPDDARIANTSQTETPASMRAIRCGFTGRIDGSGECVGMVGRIAANMQASMRTRRKHLRELACNACKSGMNHHLFFRFMPLPRFADWSYAFTSCC